MNQRPDSTEVLAALIGELRKPPNCEPAMHYLVDLMELLARRTKFVALRAGLTMSLASYISLLGIHYFEHSSGEIAPGLIVVTAILYGLVLAIVAILDYRLQLRPLETVALRGDLEASRIAPTAHLS